MLTRNAFLAIILLLMSCDRSPLAISRLTPIASRTAVRFLESNSWELKLEDVNILIDPVMSQLDFGIPFLYRGNKRFLDGMNELNSLVERTDFVLISQGFDDHAHAPTLKRLAKIKPQLQYLTAPSAKPILEACGISSTSISTLSHGKSKVLSKGKTSVEVIATQGALLGPPWQAKENGYILRASSSSNKGFPRIYYEPHCMFNPEELKQYEADVVITPVVSQELPAYTLVAGGRKALELAQLLQATTIIPMANGNLRQEGLLTTIVRTEGTERDFAQLVQRSAPHIKVLTAAPGAEVAI